MSGWPVPGVKPPSRWLASTQYQLSDRQRRQSRSCQALLLCPLQKPRVLMQVSASTLLLRRSEASKREHFSKARHGTVA